MQTFCRFLAKRYPQAWAQLDALRDITSRSELDSNEEARRRYDRLIGLPFSSWRNGNTP